MHGVAHLELLRVLAADLTDEQILERLLALNLERAAEEEKASGIKAKRSNRAKADDEMI